MFVGEPVSPGLARRIGRALERAVEGQFGGVRVRAALGRPRRPENGDYATSVAMRIARETGRPAREIAARLARELSGHPDIASAAVAGVGFVNLTVSDRARAAVVAEALAAGRCYGRSAAEQGSVLLEYVSANPTGPLHVGHGRAAAIGDSLARILRFAGAEVATEYYLNDRGRQTDVLAASLWLRVLEKRGAGAGSLPQGMYQGAYLAGVAADFCAAGQLSQTGRQVRVGSLPDDPNRAAAELTARVRAALGEESFAALRDFAVNAMRVRIADELSGCRVSHDSWFSEREMVDAGRVGEALAVLAGAGATYRADGALWFRSSGHSDEKDRVLVRGDGEHTYFASDIAYHLDKFRRGYGRQITLLGADHHGYVPRLLGIVSALGEDPARVEVLLIQFVSLVRGGRRVKMSTRSGEFATLEELVGAVGADAARLFFIAQKADSHMDFDIDLALRRDSENPLYYVQYAHARCCSLLARWGGSTRELGGAQPANVSEPAARALLAELAWFPEEVAGAARARAPHLLWHGLYELARRLHAFYDSVPVLGGDSSALASRLSLAAAARQSLANGLELLGVRAPAAM